MVSGHVDPGASPAALFGAELRHYRTVAGMTQDELGDTIGYSGAQVGAVETGRRMPTEDFARRCDDVPELKTGGALTRLRDHLRRQLHRQVWPAWFREWPSIEREATALCSWEPTGIPGLLQSEGYARAILRGADPDGTDEEIDDQVAARLDRQAILDRQDPPMLWAIMDEAVLRRRVGSDHVMREQLTHLGAVGQRPKVKILVVPMSAGAHVGLSGAFVVASFGSDPDMVYLDTAAEGQITDHPETVKACVRKFDTLRAEALPPAASLSLIAEVRDTWT